MIECAADVTVGAACAENSVQRRKSLGFFADCAKTNGPSGN